jgi:hypothetical protein
MKSANKKNRKVRYQLYLPDKEQLKRELAYAIEAEEGRRGSRQSAKRKGGGK